MKKYLSPYFFLLFVITMNSTLFAKEVYVATNGSDINDGSVNNPFATFNKAISVMEAGDVCIVREGIYEQLLSVNKSGTPSAFLTFKAAEGERVVMKATTAVNNWELHSGSIYKAQVSMPLGVIFNQVYYNEEIMNWARWPNDTDGNRFTIDAKIINGGSDSHIDADGIPDIDWTDGYVWYLGGHSGASWTRRITGSSANRINYTQIDITRWPFNPHNPTIFRNNSFGRMYLMGKLEALDQGREWYYDENDGTLYFQTPDGNKPQNGSVEVAIRERCVLVEGQYVRIEGFEIFGGNAFLKGANNIFINNKVTHGRERLDGLDNASAQISDASVEVLGRNTQIKNNTIEYGSLNGVYVYGWANNGQNTVIEGNTIRYFDTAGIHATPVRVTADNVKILKNTISQAGRDGMFVIGNNCEVAYNDVSFSQNTNSDSGVFYTVGNEADKNTEIHHNWFHDSSPPSYAGTKAAGIYLDNDSKGHLVHHNVVWNVSWSGIQLNWAIWNNNIYHNTIWNAGNAMASWINGREQKNNRIWNNYSNKPDWLRGSAYDLKNNVIAAVSPFEDASNQNFMPISSGGLVDQAIVITDFDKEFVGGSPDIGAYERGGVRWTAGVDAIIDDMDLLGVETVDFGDEGVRLYPNPTRDQFTIEFPQNTFGNTTTTVEIYTLQGKKVKSIAFNDSDQRQKTISASELSSGTYIIKSMFKNNAN